MALTSRPCRYCGARITLVRDAASGAFVPLQSVSAIYLIDDEREQTEALEQPRGRDAGLAVSHWETCPKVEQAKRAQERRKGQRAPAHRSKASRNRGGPRA